MEITFFECNSPVNMVDKVVENGITVNGKLRENSSILTPSFNIESDVIPSFNYCYIPQFNRYYYITDITSVNSKIVRIECKVDVLKSFSADIKNSLGKTRRAIKNNGYYEKTEIGVEVRKETEKVDFPNKPFDENGSIILVAINGTGVV